jgi:radical SAM superfamily enzyme YgiQ (UPF0313 family)
MINSNVSKRQVQKNPKDFRVLFVYPNMQMSSLAPISIATLSGLLKENGFDVDLFDTTLYITPYSTDTNKEKVYLSKVRPFDWEERGIVPKTGDVLVDFGRKVGEYNPDLIAFTVFENSWMMADALLRSLRRPVRTIVGGVFATFAPDIVLEHPKVDYVCRGEGEWPLLALCKSLCAGKSTDKIPNIWAKVDGTIVRNAIGVAQKLDDLPLPDWSIFEKKSFYRPMQGHVWRTIGVETQRGCPFGCTYCNSPANAELYKSEQAGKYYRKKSIKRVAAELENARKSVNPELIYFVTDNFLAMTDSEFDKFAEMYQDYRIPFWMNTRAETVDIRRAERLDLMNCLRMNIGIEHGNEKFRAEVLGRHVPTASYLKAFQACSGREFVCVANSIIGFPDETRDLAFDTIELNRALPEDIEATGAFIFTPYHGTKLRERAVRKGYLQPSTICSATVTNSSILNMPSFTPEAIKGLCRVFSFYTKMPQSRWPEIAHAELFDEMGEMAFQKLSHEYKEAYVATSKVPAIPKID